MTASTIGAMAVPEMMRRGYHRSLALGATAAGGTLGILIPPSIAMIVYGVITDTSIGHLFMAGIVPGIMLAALMSVTIVVIVLRNPSWAPPVTEQPTRAEKWSALGAVLPVIDPDRAGDRIDLFGRRNADRGRRGRRGRRAGDRACACAASTCRCCGSACRRPSAPRRCSCCC